MGFLGNCFVDFKARSYRSIICPNINQPRRPQCSNSSSAQPIERLYIDKRARGRFSVVYSSPRRSPETVHKNALQIQYLLIKLLLYISVIRLHPMWVLHSKSCEQDFKYNCRSSVFCCPTFSFLSPPSNAVKACRPSRSTTWYAIHQGQTTWRQLRHRYQGFLALKMDSLRRNCLLLPELS